MLGTPMPTKQTAPSATCRDATMVMMSSALGTVGASVVSVWTAVTAVPLSGRAGDGRRVVEKPQVVGEVGGVEHVPAHPRPERVAVAADRVPRLVEDVVAVCEPHGVRG